jgi:hypothetical protein
MFVRELNLRPVKGAYFTQEQLYALCVLICWSEGLAIPDATVHDSYAVNLMGVEGGNAGVSEYLLRNNPNVTDIRTSNGKGQSYSPINFKVLGVALVVTFDEDGVGRVCFTDKDEPF